MTSLTRHLAKVLAGVGLAIAAAGAPTDPPAETQVIEVSPQRAETLTFDTDVASVFVADEATADVLVFNQRKLYILGRAAGVTSLEVYNADDEIIATYAIRVQAETNFANRVVDRLVGDDSDIRVDSFGDALFVSGEAKSPSQAERVLSVIRAVSGDTPVVNGLSLEGPVQVNLEVVISEVSRNVTQQLGIDWSLDINPFLHPLRTLVTGAGSFRLGSGESTVAPVWAQDLEFRSLLPDGSAATTGEQQTIELGVAQPTRGGDGGIVLTHAKEINSGKYRATAFLEALAENGLAVVHARPNLTCASGESCSFNSGTQIPVPVTNPNGVVGATYQPTGVTLNFTPVVLDNDMIELNVEPGITEITTGGTNISGAFVPNINQRTVSTKVNVGNGETVAIAGLYRNTTTSSESGIPLLKDIPVWGALFRTTRESERSVELIIVVTPNFVSPIGRAASVASASPSPASTARQLGTEFYY